MKDASTAAGTALGADGEPRPLGTGRIDPGASALAREDAGRDAAIAWVPLRGTAAADEVAEIAPALASALDRLADVHRGSADREP